MACLMGSLLSTTYPVLLRYDLMEPIVWREFELVHGARLGPVIMVFHVQLMLRS
jgi:hypothetical protein